MSFFAEKHYPEAVLGSSLDEYLARGWYRMGQSIFTTHFLCFGEQLYSAIWIRLNMQQHQFRKGQRKLMRKNAERFQIKYAPFKLTQEKENLYQKYKQHFPGYIARSLQESLLDGEEYNTYHTIESQIYDGDQLVGLSYFDLGKDSVASILGIYDPAYAEYSIGYYTMLLEMEYCRQHSIKYYYPGYVVPGYERFDYKLRVGEVEYLQLSTNSWEPYLKFQTKEVPLLQMEHQLKEAQASLAKANVASQLYYYPLFEANLFGMLQATYLDFPVFLNIEPLYPTPQFRYFLVFDVRDQEFKLLRCSNFDDFRFYFNDAYTQAFDPATFLVELTVVEQLLFKTKQLEELKLVLTHNHEKLV
ncbi:MAG: GNAT family N-acetyltransferase [Lewinella sp.]|uniref:GNAT family N-acetyltransferase n=1 Tax=Lewinella sp. TaxID=2004506 RepID=UPI003D6AA85B